MNTLLNRNTAAILLATLSVSATARAAQWSGGGLTANWTNSNNWILFDVPSNDGTDNVTFLDSSPRSTSTVNQNFWINRIDIAENVNDPDSLTINSSNGAVLSLSQGIVNDVTRSQVFNVPIKAMFDLSIDNGGVNVTRGEMTFNGQLDTNGNTIMFRQSPGNITVNGSIIGSGDVIARGAGTLLLNGANTFTGRLVVNNGTVQFLSDGNLGSPSSTIRLDAMGAGSPPTLQRLITGNVSLSVNLVAGEGRLSAASGVTTTYTQGLRGRPSASLGKVGAGTVVLSASALVPTMPPFAGDPAFGETFVREGTLHLAASEALSGQRVTISTAATLSSATNTTQTLGQLFGNGNLQLGAGATLYVGKGADADTDGRGVFTGLVTGNNVEISKRAAGVLSLTNNNSYTGTTRIERGTLSADNTTAGTSATGTSVIIVQAGGTLAGGGSVFGPVSGIGTLRTGSLTLQPGATTRIDIADAAGDLINVTGSASLQGTLNIAGTVALQNSFNRRRIITTTGARTGVFSQIVGVVDSPTRSLAVTYGNDGVFLTHARPGDANLDGTVNFSDLLALAQNYGATSSQTWSLGDFSGDAATNFNDLLILAQNYNQNFAADWSLAQSMVPEPTALLAIAATVPALLRRRR
jgi:autotransporter-associated beta strand protein